MPGSWPPQTPSPSPPPRDRTPLITPPPPPPSQDVLAKRASILYTTVCIIFFATLLFCFWSALALWRVRPGQELLPSTGKTTTTSCPCHHRLRYDFLDSGCHVSPNTEQDYYTSPSGKRWRRDEPMILEACGLLGDMITSTPPTSAFPVNWREILLGSGSSPNPNRGGETAAHTGEGDDKPEETTAAQSHKDSSCPNKEEEALWAASDAAFALRARARVLLADGGARDMFEDVFGGVGAGRVFGDLCDAGGRETD